VTGVLGLTAMMRGRRGRGTRVPQLDPVDEVALSEFRERAGSPRLGPVVIVIAAYNEADGIPDVLEHLPGDVCGLHADVVVVDDGSTDGTAAALRGSRAHLVSCQTNRGQGAALRLGYRVAREHGAAYVITTDADGQYAVSDMPALLCPILENRADFVTGSRILGHQQTRDRVRRTGVHVFAWLATALTGQRFTDTSFGLRAMRAEVTAAVTLNQPQYQSSELLLGAVSHGFRVLEVPATMNPRSAGSTKKGANLVYGRRYARAMTGTWLREGLPRPVTETAPALRQTRGHGD
jgi:glycosyltransferase involved in cell wall biosynthesis